tara:strand:- start:1698 stop:2294 length:597 start_codon:yes stop_codon:yes gene_type:complete
MNKMNIMIGILAGGKATRMNNQDKGLVMYNGKYMIENIIKAVSPHTKNITINANRNILKYEKLGFPVVKDFYEGYVGPLSGIYSILNTTKSKYLMVLPCDCPLLEWKLIEKMYNEIISSDAEVVVAHNKGRAQPVFMIVDTVVKDSIKEYIESGNRKIDYWYLKKNYKYVYFEKECNYFKNINTKEELNDLEIKNNEK